MVEWMKSVQNQNIPLYSPIMLEKSEFFSAHLGYKDFKAISVWLEKFKNRNGIIYRTLNGEIAFISEEDCEKFLTDILPSLLEVYAIEDIFNTNETGIFFKCLPDKTLIFKGDTCHGGEKSVDHVTVIVCANMSGKEKLELLVIGKSKNLRCFKGVKSLPVLYKSNKKTRMTSSVYEEQLHKIDHKFQRENRKVLLLVDNCPAHPNVSIRTLKAIKVVHLPLNLTAKLQPIDQGIIKNPKVNYRQRIIKRLLKALDEKMGLTDLNLLDAIFDLKKAWGDVTSDTIADNCPGVIP
ncbi:tigger transposable element-derived protein 4-like [Belonocnema kinseyi]|uniref:tigger transposable element-derived protein 4-like n=1 Tax=Belonocnema kinseyi TaxID=2817044 RepID=UPI00143DE149|nr:tigger transposable element-derived protein 4-like [Belonocnema kinseyi]